MLSIPLNALDTYCVFGVGPHVGDKPGATLRHGQTVKLESSNVHVVTFGPDRQAKLDKDGVPTIASGNIVPVRVGGPVTVTATVMNADGAPGHSRTDSITVTAPVPAPDVPKSSGDLFKEPISLKQKAVEQPEYNTRPSGQMPDRPSEPLSPSPVPQTPAAPLNPPVPSSVAEEKNAAAFQQPGFRQPPAAPVKK